MGPGVLCMISGGGGRFGFVGGDLVRIQCGFFFVFINASMVW
jgi:hypothetical protein